MTSGLAARVLAKLFIKPAQYGLPPPIMAIFALLRVGYVIVWLSFVCVIVMIAVVPFLSGGFFLSVSCPERERQAEGEVKSRQHQNNVAASAINNSVTMIRLGISKLSPVCGAGVEAGDVGVTGSVIFVQEG